MKRKIFISINLPDKVKKRLIAAAEKWQELPVKWVREQNLHVTLLFLGYVETDILPQICQKVSDAAGETDIFDLEFDHIELAPSANEPRMIWLTGEPNENLLKLYEKIEKELGIFVAEKKSFRPHITLGRIRRGKWQALENKPSIFEKFPLNLSVESADVVASDFGDRGQEYAIIESCALK